MIYSHVIFKTHRIEPFGHVTVPYPFEIALITRTTRDFKQQQQKIFSTPTMMQKFPN